MSNYDLLFYCAPTLASVKLGSLFTVKYDSVPQLELKIKEKNQLLEGKGVYIRILKWMERTALIYVYRESQLKTSLKSEEIRDFLREFGYEDFSLEMVLKKLEEDLLDKDFPHHIGVFLGYPLADIRGFIQHRGKNCCCTGVWKVYHDQKQAEKTFSQYKKCVKVYLERYAQGVDFNRLIVAG